MDCKKHLSNTLALPSLKRLRVSAQEFPQQLVSNRKPFLTVPRYTTFEMASIFLLAFFGLKIFTQVPPVQPH